MSEYKERRTNIGGHAPICFGCIEKPLDIENNLQPIPIYKDFLDKCF